MEEKERKRLINVLDEKLSHMSFSALKDVEAFVDNYEMLKKAEEFWKKFRDEK